MTDGRLLTYLMNSTDAFTIRQPARATVTFPPVGDPWWETVILAFQLLASRADRDAEFRGFLTDAGVTVTAADGSPMWPPTPNP